MSAKVLVWGAGAIGGSVGAWLGRAGHHVTFVDASAAHVAAIRSHGLRIVGPIDRFVVRAPAFLPSEVEGEWKICLLAVKAQHTETACRALLPHLARDGYVVSLQNGLCETTISGVVEPERTIGALVGFAGDQLGPGEVRFGQRAKFCIGELDGRISGRLEALAKLLRDFEPELEVTSAIWGYLWGKLGFVGLLYGTALGASTLAELFSRRELLPAWRGIAGEIVAVAAAEGVEPIGFDGFDPAAFAARASEAAAWRSMQAMANLLRGSAKTHSGMWRDLAIHHRRTEIDDQIGPVIAAAETHAIATPALRRLTDLIHAVERGERSQSDALIGELLPLGAPPSNNNGELR